jgi:glycosyltransferase involved in cell wall biosynthesis
VDRLRPPLSVIIPVCNRGDLIRYTLESVRRASEGLSIEVVILDDGSTEPAEAAIRRLGFSPERIIRQENQGLLFARLAGLRAATGKYVLFLDSDDLISSDKLRLQIAALEESGAEVSYSDTARTTLDREFDELVIEPDAPAETTADGTTFFIRVQPAPHSPVFRTDFLRKVVAEACFPPDPLYNPVAEIWFYHNAAIHPSLAVKVPGPHTIIGSHPGTRLTNHWERLGVASLAVMEAFARTCPRTPATARARQLVAEKAFHAWRRLPRGFSREFDRRELEVWRTLRQSRDTAKLGGKAFQLLACGLGPAAAARLLRRWQNGSYENCRSMDDAAVRALLDKLSPPNKRTT